MGSEFWKKSRQVFLVADKVIGKTRSISGQTDALGESQFVPMDVYETRDEFIIELDLPGASISDINVTVQSGLLKIEGIKKETPELKEKVNYLCMEREFGPIRRVIKLSSAVDASSISGSYDNGVLTIKAPKRKDRRKRTLKVPID